MQHVNTDPRVVGMKLRADKTGYHKVFMPAEFGEDSGDGIPYRETLDWLQQWYPARARAIETKRRVILMVGDETYPREFWSMRNNHYRGTAYLEWVRPPELVEEEHAE